MCQIFTCFYCVIHPACLPNLYRQLTKCCMQKAAKSFPAAQKAFSPKNNIMQTSVTGLHTLNSKKVIDSVLNAGFREVCGWKPWAQATPAHIPLLLHFLTVFPAFFFPPHLAFIPYWYSEDEWWWGHVHMLTLCVGCEGDYPCIFYTFAALWNPGKVTSPGIGINQEGK